MLQPLDVYVLAGLVALADDDWTFRSLADKLEVPHASVQRGLARAAEANLFLPEGRGAHLPNFEEFLVQSRGAYYTLAERLRERGLTERMDEPVVCRWRHASGLVIDVMPIAADVLGFSNPWYRLGIETSVERTLDSGTSIRAVAPPVAVATKLAVWLGRGKNDVIRSLDVHDILRQSRRDSS